MNNLVAGLLDNESTFGKAMTRCGIIIAVSLMFALCTIPIITIGAGWAGMSHAMLRLYRCGGVINPFKEFWNGFKNNFRQSTVVWIISLLFGGLLGLEWYWCTEFNTSFFLTFRFCFVAIGAVLVVMLIYIFPDIAAFNGSIKDHIKNSVFFAFSAPANLGILLLAYIVPAVLTYVCWSYYALIGFLWITCGFALLSQLTCKLLVKEYEPHLARVDKYGNILADDEEDVSEDGSDLSDKEILEEMKKLDM